MYFEQNVHFSRKLVSELHLSHLLIIIYHQFSFDGIIEKWNYYKLLG